MDTGDLSEEIHRVIMVEAEKFNHDLTLQFDLLSGECKDEEDFIKKSLILIEKMKKYDEIDLDDRFLGNPPKMENFHNVLKRMIENIEKIQELPIEKRTYLYG